MTLWFPHVLKGNYIGFQDYLEKNKEITIDLRSTGYRDNEFTPEEIRHLFLALQGPGVKNITAINLGRTSIGEGGTAKLIAKKLAILENVTSIDFSYTGIGDVDTEMLAKALPYKAVKINFSGNVITEKGVKAIAREMRIRSVAHCIFSNNWITNAGAKIIAANLPSEISSIDLSNNFIEDEGLKDILRSLPCTMNSLNLSKNRFTDEGAKIAFKLMKTKISGDLNLSGNKIGDNGAKAIANALKNNDSQLTSLNLSNNRIENEGAIAIALVLSPTLTALNFADNKISDKGVKAIFWNLPASVKILNLYANIIGDESARFIGEALAWTGVEKLYIAANYPMTDTGKQCIKLGLLNSLVTQTDIGYAALTNRLTAMLHPIQVPPIAPPYNYQEGEEFVPPLLLSQPSAVDQLHQDVAEDEQLTTEIAELTLEEKKRIENIVRKFK